MKRWDFLAEGEELFFGAPPAPCDFYVLIDDNKKLGAFCRNPILEAWLWLYNPEHFGLSPFNGMCRTAHLSGDLTVVEMKDKVEEMLCSQL